MITSKDTKKNIKWWKRRNFDLRQACIDKYSKEFDQKYAQEIGEMYNKTCRGEFIDGFLETSIFLDMIEKLKKKVGYTNYEV